MAKTVTLTVLKEVALRGLPQPIRELHKMGYPDPSWDPESKYALVADYDEQILSIRPGDTVDIEDDSLLVVRRLGSDSASVIFEMSDGRAHRFRKTAGTSGPMEAYLKTYLGLRNSGAQIVQVYMEESNSYRTVTTLLRKILVLEDFLQSLRDRPRPMNGFDRRLLEALVPFEASIARYSRIDDVNLTQIGWNGRRWEIFDWHSPGVLAKSVTDESPVFDGFVLPYFGDVIPPDITQSVRRAVRGARANLQCEKILAPGRASRPERN